MKKSLLLVCAIFLAVPASGQPGGGGPRSGGPQGGGPPRTMEVKPVARARFDEIVAAMFREADGNRDDIVTIEEIGAIAAARREIMIGARFERIDANRDRSISRDEFFTWQRGLGSLAQSEAAQAIGRGGLVPETVEPDYSNEREARLLLGLIEPLSSVVVVNANLDYDAGLSLAELLVWQGKRFEAADRDHNGAISMGEARQPEGRLPGGAFGLPPARAPDPPSGDPRAERD